MGARWQAHERLHLVSTNTDATGIVLPLGQGVAGYVISSASIACINDAYSDARFDRTTDERTGFTTRNILAVPLLLGSRAVRSMPLHTAPRCRCSSPPARCVPP